MTELEAKACLIALNLRSNPLYQAKKPGEILFPKQADFAKDPDTRKLALCSRRAGKTTVAADALIQAALKYPAVQFPYIALTRESAKRIIWTMLFELLEKYGIPFKPNESELSIKFENRSILFCYGADQKDLIARLRGSKYGMAVIDECQSYRPSLLKSLIYDVLDAGLQDLNGPLWLLGTPGPVCVGDWYDLSSGQKKGFSRHYWSVLDNPYLDGKAIMARVMEKNGWDINNATLQREWFGKWVEDTEKRLVQISDDNVVDQMPELKDRMHVIGIDYGWNDQTAFTVLAYSHLHPNVYAVKSIGASEKTITETAETLQRLMKEYPDSIIVADTGGLGKSITEEIKQRHSINIYPAEKSHKLTNIQIMNDALRKKTFKILSSEVDLIHQLKVLQRGDNGLEHPDQPADLFDSCLYALTKARHYVYQEPILKPHRDSQAFMDLQEEIEAEQMRQANQKEWWE